MGTLDFRSQFHVSFLSLGSNIGNRKKNLLDAITELTKNHEIKINKISSIYETEPQNFLYQKNFFNCAAKICTTLTPQKLLKFCQKVENDLGRIKTFKYGPRKIDIDILLYDDLKLNTIFLKIPHPEIVNRNFVLSPLIELQPDLTINGKKIINLQKKCSDQKITKLFTVN